MAVGEIGQRLWHLVTRLKRSEENLQPLRWEHDETKVIVCGLIETIDDYRAAFRVQRLRRLTDENDLNCFIDLHRADLDANCQQTDCMCHRGVQLSYSAYVQDLQDKQEVLCWIEAKETAKETCKQKRWQTFADYIHHLCRTLLICPIIDAKDWSVSATPSEIAIDLPSEDAVRRHSNLCSPICVVETGNWFYAVSSADDDRITLWDAAAFNTHVLRDCADRLLMVAYELLSVLAYCQRTTGFLPAELRADCVEINGEDFWCCLDVWRCLQYSVAQLRDGRDDRDEPHRRTLDEWTNLWTHGSLSNFDYIMVLNEFARRRPGDPYYHPIFPWVCDFSVPTSPESELGWRDLSKTKYRLTRGDQQLDQTFSSGLRQEQTAYRERSDSAKNLGHRKTPSVVPNVCAALPPHHVTEFLSDIGYYVYESRRTPKCLLRKYIRRHWVPEEYPVSVRRLYEWTPDEAIPEFYSDPGIFRSIHSDLCSLELPDWMSDMQTESCPWEAFIIWHRRLLESDWVSERLHNWIDLIFGYKLTGEPAVVAKNVQLRLVERADRLTRDGVVQLFTKPHRRRRIKEKNAITSLSSAAALQDAMNPLYELENTDTLTPTDGTGLSKTTASNESATPLDIWRGMKAAQLSRKTRPVVAQCLASFGVLLVELCIPTAFRHLPRTASKNQRFQAAKHAVFNGQTIALPRSIKSSVEILLSMQSYDPPTCLPIDALILCPGMLLQPLTPTFSFPHYLAPMYDCFQRVKSLEIQFDACLLSNCADFRQFTDLADSRVRLVAKLLPLILPHCSLDAVLMLVGLTKRALLNNCWTRVLAVWSLWNPLAQALGPSLTEKHLLDCVLNLYDVDTPCSSKFLKLYHRTFLLQLVVRLGTQRFFDYFIEPLVQAVAGERNSLYHKEETYWRAVIERRTSNTGEDSPTQLARQTTESVGDSMSTTDSPTDTTPAELMTSAEGNLQDDLDSVVQFQLELDDGQMKTDVVRTRTVTPSCESVDNVETLSLRSSTSSQSLYSSIPRIEEPTENAESSNSLVVSDVAEESILWLANRSGPLLTARHLSKNLLRMLALCYGTDRLEPSVDGLARDSWYPVLADVGASGVLRCLEEIAAIYGEQTIIRHYFVYVGELVAQASKRLTPNMEMALLACVALLRHMFPLMTHEQLMENLKDHTLIDNLFFPLIRTASSVKVIFSNSAVRTTLNWKLAETLYWLGVRVGGENVKTYLFVLVQRLFCTYDFLYRLEQQNGQVYVRELPPRSGDSDAAFVQLKATFTPALADRMFRAFVALCGHHYLELSMANGELLTRLCQLAQREMDGCCDGLQRPMPDNYSFSSQSAPVIGSRSSGVSLSSREHQDRLALEVACRPVRHSSRKLKGNWLAYWEYELGRDQKETHFYFKHMKLQSFVGHSNSVRKVCVLNNENSFISASHDRTVKLWSLRSHGDGDDRVACQFTYKSHKKPLWDVAFMDSMRLVASTDGSVHIWDPFMGMPLREWDFDDTSDPQQQPHMATVIEAVTAPSRMLLVAGTFSTVRCLDMRQAKWAHEFKIGASQLPINTTIKAMCIDSSDSTRWLAVACGLGTISTLDIRTGRLLGQKKVCETDIFSLATFDAYRFLACPFDQRLCLMKANDCSVYSRIPNNTDAIVAMVPYHNELLCATQSNRLRIYTQVDADATFTDTRLRPDVFQGSVSCMQLLPLNKLLLLGSTTGNIELLC